MSIRVPILSFLVTVFLALGCWASPSPAASNPVFQVLLASLLNTEHLSNEAKIEKLDQFLRILQISFDERTPRIPVADFKSYLALRNQTHPTVEAALEVSQKKGILTPLSVKADPQVMEQIIAFEMQEMKEFLNFSKQQLPENKTGSGLQSPVWNLLSDLYLFGLEFKTSLDDQSNQMIQNSFEFADQMKKKRNPLGLFAFSLGAGLSVARAVGENLVNPTVDRMVYGETLQNQVRRKVLIEINKITQWPAQKKLDLVNEFQETIDSTLNREIRKATENPTADQLAQRFPLVTVIKDKLMPFYFSKLSSEQKSNLIWAVYNHPNFVKASPTEQMQTALNALGPVFPFLLRQLAKLPESKDHPLTALLCCETSNLKTNFNWSELQSKISEEISKSGYQMLRLDSKPLAVSPFKETFSVQAKGPSGEERLIVQVLRPGVEKRLQDDIRLLRLIESNRELQTALSEAGAPEIRPIIETVIGLAQNEVDSKKAENRWLNIEKNFHQKQIKTLNGRPFEIELRAARPVGSVETNSQFSIYEFAKGDTLSEARKTDPEVVEAATSAFAEQYIKQALSGSGLIWADPSERNMRIEISKGDSRAQLTFFNIETSEVLTVAQLKSFYANLARLPLSALAKANLGTSPEQLSQIQVLIQKTIDSGLQMDTRTLKFAMGLLQIRNLVGPETFRKLILKTVLSNPSTLWSILGPLLKLKLSDIYSPIRSSLEGLAKSFQLSSSASASGTSAHGPLLCQKLYSRH